MSDDPALLPVLCLAADEADEQAPHSPEPRYAWHRAFLASLREQGFDVVRTH